MGFTLYTPEMQVLNFPVGIKPLDLLASSVGKERIEETIDGIPGTIDYGFNYSTREVKLTFWLTHFHGEHDYHLMKAELNNLLDKTEFMYISTDALPSRMLKITVDEAYIPERILYSNASQLEITARISGLPFWRTKYTTQDIETSGYSSIAEKYGTADSIHIDHTKYTHTANEFTIYNAGNVTIDPRNMMLNIRLYRLVTQGEFKLKNLTTGEEFQYKGVLTGNTVDLNGIKVLIGLAQNRLRDTNREFISLVPGENKITISGGTVENIQFDFPFYYK
nr:phage tail family protein [Mammaliicoccus sp. Marseille-Q6498]